MNNENKKINVALTTFAVVSLFGFSTLAAEPMVKGDNSAVNSRIEANHQMDAQDQGTSESDVRTTQLIRQQVVDQTNFSTNAKNVKIITKDGLVVLKGPVKTMAEKNKIESIAVNAAGKTKVVSELTVTK